MHRLWIGWCVEMCDINNDFDKHCILSQKLLLQGNILKKIILNLLINDIQIYLTFIYMRVSQYITCSDFDCMINIPHLIFIGTINQQRVADWFTSPFYKIF